MLLWLFKEKLEYNSFSRKLIFQLLLKKGSHMNVLIEQIPTHHELPHSNLAQVITMPWLFLSISFCQESLCFQTGFQLTMRNSCSYWSASSPSKHQPPLQNLQIFDLFPNKLKANNAPVVVKRCSWWRYCLPLHAISFRRIQRYWGACTVDNWFW